MRRSFFYKLNFWKDVESFFFSRIFILCRVMTECGIIFVDKLIEVV